MTRKYFGTDGVRGKVGEAPITPEFALKLGWAAGRTLATAGVLVRRAEVLGEGLLSVHQFAVAVAAHLGDARHRDAGHRRRSAAHRPPPRRPRRGPRHPRG